MYEFILSSNENNEPPATLVTFHKAPGTRLNTLLIRSWLDRVMLLAVGRLYLFI